MERSDFLPDFVIGGAPRCGTTFLAELLSKHPGIYFKRPLLPEPKICLTPDSAGDEGLRERYAALFRDAPPDALRAEKTSNYFENDAARQRLARLLPATRFIFILREPIARAYSNWRWSTANGLETLSFDEAIAREGMRPSPFPPEREYVRPFDYMRRGCYGSLAEAWINAIGRERVAFLVYENLVDKPELFLAEIQRFIGVTPVPWSVLRTGRINQSPADAVPVHQDRIDELRRRIAPEVHRFSALTALDVSVWGY
jgi:hypothetical protein